MTARPVHEWPEESVRVFLTDFVQRSAVVHGKSEVELWSTETHLRRVIEEAERSLKEVQKELTKYQLARARVQ